MQRGDFYNTTPRFYRRRNGVTTLWGNGVLSATGILNILMVTIAFGFIGVAAWFCVTALAYDIVVRQVWTPGVMLGVLLTVPGWLIASRYMVRVHGLWWKALFTIAGRRLLIFNSRRLWVRGLTPGLGVSWSDVEVRFLSKRYMWMAPSYRGYGLKTKIFTSSGHRFFREWDIWLAVGRDLKPMLVYDLWRYAQRNGNAADLIDLNVKPPIPYPEGYD
ncbi:hypothetical protein PQU92_11705 [Asticcacaulis sp. BYS171W]|uniref:PH domain-containing protein n=1 Tax=Asticcacaulis aquaticus TaxID=2984212 RepID=A0ABT5HV66_9CAUL|nr:hypothetical protein [Asticcacaulis aquaticus]MDC7683944.1 hypothetical protein [Asticcacaulis aquaticus]